MKTFKLIASMCTCLMVFALVTLGCGGGDSESGGENAANACEDACSKIDGAKCTAVGLFEPNRAEAASDCIRSCENQWYRDECGSQIDLRTSCIAKNATITCDPYGWAMLKGCDSEEVALNECLACIPRTEDDGCCACSKSTCCNERKALFASLDAMKKQQCRDACADSACEQACHGKYPSLDSARQAYDDCMKSKCGGCPCG